MNSTGSIGTGSQGESEREREFRATEGVRGGVNARAQPGQAGHVPVPVETLFPRFQKIKNLWKTAEGPGRETSISSAHVEEAKTVRKGGQGSDVEWERPKSGTPCPTGQ